MKEKIEDIAKDISGAITKNTKYLMLFGIFSLIFGIIGLFMSPAMTIASILVFGIFVLITGGLFLYEGFTAPKWDGRFLNILLSLIYLAAGVIMLVYPGPSAIWFTLFIAAFLIVMGTIRIIMGFKAKSKVDKWMWIVFSGVLNIVLGILIYAQWPLSGEWVIGLFISIDLMIQGINAIVISQTVKENHEDIATQVKHANEMN